MTELWVCLGDLVPDSCNFKDKSFEADVNEFMERLMPGGPIGLLDTSSEKAFERWQIQGEGRFYVEEYEDECWVCPKCERRSKDDKPCCLDDEGDAIELEDDSDSGWVVKDDEDVDNFLDGRGALDHVQADGKTIPVFYKESLAEDAATEANDEEGGSRVGFPWAHSWWHLPDRVIRDDELKRAGFVVATYVGGGGDARNDEEFRLCGIDGGGYSFSGQHFAKLYAIVAERLHWPVKTDRGSAYITVERKSVLEEMAETD